MPIETWDASSMSSESTSSIASSITSPRRTNGSKPKYLQSAYYDKEQGMWRCRNCGGAYPNPRPRSRERRDHKRFCEETLIKARQQAATRGEDLVFGAQGVELEETSDDLQILGRRKTEYVLQNDHGDPWVLENPVFKGAVNAANQETEELNFEAPKELIDYSKPEDQESQPNEAGLVQESQRDDGRGGKSDAELHESQREHGEMQSSSGQYYIEFQKGDEIADSTILEERDQQHDNVPSKNSQSTDSPKSSSLEELGVTNNTRIPHRSAQGGIKHLDPSDDHDRTISESSEVGEAHQEVEVNDFHPEYNRVPLQEAEDVEKAPIHSESVHDYPKELEELDHNTGLEKPENWKHLTTIVTVTDSSRGSFMGFNCDGTDYHQLDPQDDSMVVARCESLPVECGMTAEEKDNLASFLPEAGDDPDRSGHLVLDLYEEKRVQESSEDLDSGVLAEDKNDNPCTNSLHAAHRDRMGSPGLFPMNLSEDTRTEESYKGLDSGTLADCDDKEKDNTSKSSVHGADEGKSGHFPMNVYGSDQMKVRAEESSEGLDIDSGILAEEKNNTFIASLHGVGQDRAESSERFPMDLCYDTKPEESSEGLDTGVSAEEKSNYTCTALLNGVGEDRNSHFPRDLSDETMAERCKGFDSDSDHKGKNNTCTNSVSGAGQERTGSTCLNDEARPQESPQGLDTRVSVEENHSGSLCGNGEDRTDLSNETSSSTEERRESGKSVGKPSNTHLFQLPFGGMFDQNMGSIWGHVGALGVISMICLLCSKL